MICGKKNLHEKVNYLKKTIFYQKKNELFT